jgi:hypothetical protein
MGARFRWLGVLLAGVSVAACGSSDKAGSSGGAGNSGSSGSGNVDSFWDSIPGGDGQQAQHQQAFCEAQCARDGACGFWDATECADGCDDPRDLCQADLTTPECFSLYVTWQQCVAALSCTERDQYYFQANLPARPCQAELDAYEAGGCPDITTGHYTECVEQVFFCDGDRELSPYWICDGGTDCTDGTDEADCPWLGG